MSVDFEFIEGLEENEFRDHVATVDKHGKRIWIYPKKPQGPFYQYRKYVSYFLLAVLFALPFIKYNGRPFVQFNIPQGEFTIFGIFFSPQDFYLFVIAMLIGLLFIVLFTVIYGRLFCGWVCPQTIFMEMVFRRIEYWIEGDANAQRKLNASPWTTDKIIIKVSKQAIFIFIALIISHLFLSYIIGVDEVFKIITDPISEHWKGFIAMVIFSFLFYGVFAFMREQVCTTICPYGRLQGVMLDENSLAVSYDFVRGEPRGKLTRKKIQDAEASGVTLNQGDCIDCKLCVQVCPTGIDIRNGTQLECVNCTACIDACDEVMMKIDKPTQLIRIDSYNGIVHKKQSLFNTRVIAYSVVLAILIGLESFLMLSRSDVDTLILRTPGMTYQDNKDGYISNLYNYKLNNKTDDEYPVTFKVTNIDGALIEVVGEGAKTLKKQTSEGVLFIKIPKDKLKGQKTDLEISVLHDGQIVDETSSTFFGPIK